MDGLTPLGAALQARDLMQIALEVLHAVDTLQPMEPPGIPSMSPELFELMNAKFPSTVPKHLRKEHEVLMNAIKQRANTRGENMRRLRTTLWAEQSLRSHQRQEHKILRAFNRDVWFVRESASRDVAEREAQVREHV